MTKDEMINKIYEVIADKTLSFWCIAEYKYNGFQKLLLCIQSYSIWNKYWTPLNYTNNPVEIDISEMRKIIWHPVMIGDVYQWLFDNKMESNVVYVKNPIRWWKVEPYSSNKEFIFWRRENRRKPIENQSEECITFIYNLIIKHVPKKENSN